VTPAHSHTDFELSQRHDLPLLNIIDDDGRLINVPQSFLVDGYYGCGIKHLSSQWVLQSVA